MAAEALINAHLTLNSVDMSDHVTDLSVDVTNDGQDITNFGSGGGQDMGKGLETSTLNFTVLNDYAASSINATMSAIVGTKVAFSTIPGAGTAGTAVSATNPSYSGTVYVTNWQPITGAPGDFQRVSVSYPVCGTVTMGTS